MKILEGGGEERKTIKDKELYHHTMQIYKKGVSILYKFNNPEKPCLIRPFLLNSGRHQIRNLSEAQYRPDRRFFHITPKLFFSLPQLISVILIKHVY
jgi:hypothetical protein